MGYSQASKLIAVLPLIAALAVVTLALAAFSPNVNAFTLPGQACSNDAQCGNAVTLCTQDSGHRPGYECSLSSGAWCSSYCSAALKQCLCERSPTGLCSNPSDCSAGSHASTGQSCTVDGEAGEVYTCNCPSCGNTLTYCKEKQAAATATPTETPEIQNEVEPTAEPETYSGYCGDGVCERGEESYCARDCLSPYGAYCLLSAYPKHVALGASTEIDVRYFNTLYSVAFVPVNCGNGLIMYAWNCGGRTGECYARCRYAAPGTYTVTAFAGGVYCRQTVVSAGSAPSPTATPTPAPRLPIITPQPSVTPRNPRCVVETLPPIVYGSGVSNIKTPYYDLDRVPTQSTVICGNGEIVYGVCEGSAAQGNCVASCVYSRPLRYPWAYSVDAVVGGVQCVSGTVSLLEGGTTPTATPNAQTTGALVVTVLREDGVRTFWGAVVRVPTRGDFRTGYDGLVEVSSLNAGDYALVASADGYETQRVTARVRGGETTRITVIMREAGAPAPTVTPIPTPTANAPQNGALTVRVTECGNGGAVSGAKIDLTQRTVPRQTQRGTYYTDAYGAVTINDLPTGDYIASISADGYASQQANARVNAGASNSLSICLQRSTQTQPHCAVAIVPATLKTGESGSVSVTYDGFAAQPESIIVQCGNGATTAAQCNGNGVGGSGSCVGGYCSYANNGAYYLTASSGATQCNSATTDVSARGSDELYIQALETEKQGYGGQKTCFALLLRNGGESLAVVALSASASPSNDWKTSFADAGNQKFVIVPHEIKNVDFCVDVPEAASGTVTYTISAVSEINDATASVMLRAFGSSDYSIDYSGCFGVEADKGWVTRVVRVTNNAADGNYVVEIGDNELGVEADDVYAFKKGETRDVALRFTTEGLENKNYYFTFDLKRRASDGSTSLVLQRTLCVRPNGAGTGAVTLYPSSLTVGRGSTQTATVRVRNDGSSSATFYVSALKKTGLTVSVSPQYLSLESGSEGTATVSVTADSNAALGPISVPVRVYNSGYYNGYDNNYNNGYGNGYNYGNGNYGVEFDCGNGETRGVQCGYGDGSCSVSCPYASTGYFTPRANLHGNSCSATQVRVLDYYPSNSLVLRAETPFLPSSGTTNIRIDYYSLNGGSGGSGSNNYAPVISNVEIDPRATNADVYWVTNENANSRVDYAYANHTDYHSVSNSNYVTSHQVTLSNLAANTTYVFNVTSCDADGGCTTDGEYELKTNSSGLLFASRETTNAPEDEMNENAKTLYFDSTLVRVYCGNGQTQTAYCASGSGSCSASCYYANTGVYDVTASVDGASPTIYATRVTVGRTDNEACFLTTDPQTIRDGESAAIKMNYYKIPNDGTNGGNNGNYYNGNGYYGDSLIDSQTLLVNVVATQPTGNGNEGNGPLISERLEIDASDVNAAPGTRTNAPITIRNKNYYDITGLVVYADGLPNGVTAKTINAFPLAAGDEKTIVLEFNVGDVPAGDYEIALHAESAVAQAPIKKVKLHVRGAIGEAQVSVSEPSTSVKREETRFVITLAFNVKNEAGETKTLSAAIEGLPAGWTYGMTPLGGATLSPNETREYTATIFAPLNAFDEYREYPATLAISDETGKTKRFPLAINKNGANVLSGFFVALGGDYGLFALFIVLVAVGAALYYVAQQKMNRAEQEKQETREKQGKPRTPTKTKNAGKTIKLNENE